MPILAFIFLVVPIIEIYVIIKVGGVIGALPTVGLMLLTATTGAYLAQSQGRQVWARFNRSMSQGKAPGKELSDGAMIIFGGALLISPGFITDVLGITLLLPPTRLFYRKLLLTMVKRTPVGAPVFVWQYRPDRFRDQGSSPGASPGPGPAPTRSYDVEGTAREVSGDPSEIESGNG